MTAWSPFWSWTELGLVEVQRQWSEAERVGGKGRGRRGSLTQRTLEELRPFCYAHPPTSLSLCPSCETRGFICSE